VTVGVVVDGRLMANVALEPTPYRLHRLVLVGRLKPRAHTVEVAVGPAVARNEVVRVSGVFCVGEGNV